MVCILAFLNSCYWVCALKRAHCVAPSYCTTGTAGAYPARRNRRHSKGEGGGDPCGRPRELSPSSSYRSTFTKPWYLRVPPQNYRLYQVSRLENYMRSLSPCAAGKR